MTDNAADDPVLGSIGYPTMTELNRIGDWNISSEKDIRDLLGYVRARWTYPDYFPPLPAEDAKEFIVSTAGWSGNEDLIEALSENTMFWALCWVQSKRGGHHTFSIPVLAEKEP